MVQHYYKANEIKGKNTQKQPLKINDSKQKEKKNTRRTADRSHPREAHSVVF